MPLTPTFSVTPLNPISYSYDSAFQTCNYYGQLQCFGVFLDAYDPNRLTDLYSQDKAHFRYKPVAEPAPGYLPSEWTKYSVAFLGFRTKATTANQYLLIYHVVGSLGSKAAFYINGNLVKTEDVAGEEYIAILADCPPSQTWWYVYMFLVGGGALDLKGIECYVI